MGQQQTSRTPAGQRGRLHRRPEDQRRTDAWGRQHPHLPVRRA